MFENLEYATLVSSLEKILDISPRIKSITMHGCFSKFVQNTIVPVQFTNRAANNASPVLFSHITALQPLRRREEYMKHNFQLHDRFSDALYRLLQINETHLLTLDIQDCTLDLEMTELFCAIACHGHALESLTYINNHDKGIHSSGLLQAIVTSCPNMRHFRGLHSGMNDAVLLTIARHWTSLQSLTLCSHKSREYLGHAEIISDGRRHSARLTLSTDCISSHALWQILSRCPKLHTLELFDLACITNSNLAVFDVLRLHSLQQKENERKLFLNNSASTQSRKRFSPYNIPSIKPNHSTAVAINNHSNPSSKHLITKRPPGSSIQHLIITKYMTAPLSKPGFESLLQLFPNLKCLEYETNFHTFDNLLEGVTHNMFETQCEAIEKWCDEKKKLVYIGRWNAPVTAEQRLMAGMASVSEGHNTAPPQ